MRETALGLRPTYRESGEIGSARGNSSTSVKNTPVCVRDVSSVRVHVYGELYGWLSVSDCGPPPVMNLATYTVEPDMGTITNDTVYPRDSIATYTCDEGSEFADLSRSKTSLCGIGGVWSHDVVLDPCESQFLKLH